MRIAALFTVLLYSFIASSEQLDVVVGWDKPPYVMSADHSGFELELTRAILKELGHELSPIYVPFGRTARLLKDDAVDIALTLNKAHKVSADILSDPYVVYQNVVVTREDRNIAVSDLASLRGKSIIAFQTAKNVLGKEYGNTLASQPNYLEMARQDRQVNMLMLGSVDAVIMDRNIFSYLKARNDAYSNDAVTIHELFPVSAYCAGIPNPELRAQFNATLNKFIENGRYQALLTRFGLENLFDKLVEQQSHINES
jgi:polar amino acid transport system substrate-binding protein